MKVNIYVTEDVTDQERKQISEVLGVKQATRDQLKEFLWKHGQNWRTGLGTSPVPVEEADDLAALL